MLRSAISARPSLSSSTLASTSKLSNNAFSTSTRIRQAAPAPEQPKMVKLTVDGKEVEVVQGCVTVEMEMSKSKSDPHSTSLTPFSFSSFSRFYRTALIQACEKAGAQIPRFCYHERVSTRFNSKQSNATLFLFSQALSSRVSIELKWPNFNQLLFHGYTSDNL